MNHKLLFGARQHNKLLISLLVLLSLNAWLWTAFASLGGSPALSGDSLEAFVWGQEFQLGYYKHPPFWAWIAGAWFSLFPHKDWAFYLLSELNASLGILGTWALLGRFTKGPERLAGTLLLLLTTFYNVNALRFNANTIQLSLWPWTMYFFLLSVEKKTAGSGIALGVIAGLAMLSKYYAALLLLSCLLAALVHRNRREYLQSPAPWAALLTLFALVAPHIAWVINHGDQPLLYAARQTEHPKSPFNLLLFLLTCVLYHLLQLGVIMAAKLTQKMRGEPIPISQIKHGAEVLSVLALGPLALTSMVGLLGYRVTSPFIIPIFSLTPFLLLYAIGAHPKRVVRSTAWIYGVVVAACLILAPVLPDAFIRIHTPPEPLRQVALVALAEWKKTTHAPLTLVAGSEPYSEALAFYAPTGTAEFTDFNFSYAPWVTKERVRQQGLLVICLEKDSQCLDHAAPFEITGTRTVKAVVVPRWGPFLGTATMFTIVVVPPKIQEGRKPNSPRMRALAAPGKPSGRFQPIADAQMVAWSDL